MQSFLQKKEFKRESCQGIFFDDVLDLIPEDHAVIVRSSSCPFCDKITIDPKDFKKFKFEAIKWIKKKEDPEDRVWPFECKGDDGVWSYDKQIILVEARKTREEKNDEREEYYELQKLFRKHGIE